MPAVRTPCRAGQFYPSDAAACREMLEGFFAGIQPQPATGAVVPHAGWVYSGAAAARGIACIGAARPETVVLFGAMHTADVNPASLYPTGHWQSPLGLSAIDAELVKELRTSELICANTSGHRQEHSIEVLLPMIQFKLPNVAILPITVRPSKRAGQVGREVAGACKRLSRKAAYVASTDLTHYGPAFGYVPAGLGEEGVRWAKNVNDRQFIERIAAMDEAGVIEQAAANRNACGAGAVAALIGAMHAVGAQGYIELSHTTSAEVPGMAGRGTENAVGYEAGIFPVPE
ncbi:MAG: AmmeMemoRadiSam system protein B [Phycisphaerae bacterium]|nr:AmmeMemoRadiSam system protein B [Phycisphaerae bacterium]